jgi:hypothetical protein
VAQIPTVISGQTITSSWGNAVRDQTVQLFASTAERDAAITAPVAGQVCWVGNGLQVYNGATWRTIGPGLVLPPIRLTANAGPTTAEANIPGSGFNLTAVAGRVYEVSLQTHYQMSVPDGRGTFYVKEGSTIHHAFNLEKSSATGAQAIYWATLLQGLTAGVHSLNVTMAASTGTITMVATPTAPMLIYVRDIGAA